MACILANKTNQIRLGEMSVLVESRYFAVSEAVRPGIKVQIESAPAGHGIFHAGFVCGVIAENAITQDT